MNLHGEIIWLTQERARSAFEDSGRTVDTFADARLERFTH